MRADIIELRPEGLYCTAGDFYIDPWQPVPMAIITHAHSDHARRGCEKYLSNTLAKNVLYKRLGNITLQTIDYGEIIRHRGVRVSLYPAGHILGSAQVKIEYRGETWVVSGDYKVENDNIHQSFEPIQCDTFITESTFGLPIYRWQPQSVIQAQINNWWKDNASQNRTSILFCYALGKAQRLLSLLDCSIGPIVAHGAIEPINQIYRETGVALPQTYMVTQITDKVALEKALVLAPPSASRTNWLKRFGHFSDAFASGWMQIRGRRRIKSIDRGFVLSDHADWAGLLSAIRETNADRIIVTHGYSEIFARYLNEQGFDAQTFSTKFGENHENDDSPLDHSIET
ncbi:MAG: ligase-associated DNA damage response exonuclease [Nitrosomonas sp.]|nr:ligase-associated DNA damage response exonuclease [Nitrosomonas sp.]